MNPFLRRFALPSSKLGLKENNKWTIQCSSVSSLSSTSITKGPVITTRAYASQLNPLLKEDLDVVEERAPLRPIWFIFTGLGSQRNQIPQDLYRIEPFAESLIRSRGILRNLGVDMETVLHPNNEKIYTCIRTALMSLSVIQMALYDTIKTLLPTQPSGFIGHSAGEAICGYADGSLTAEHVLLIGEARAKAMMETKGSYSGGMASIGMSWSQIQSRVPRDVFPACNNARNNVIVAGPRPSIRSFIKELEKESVFAREVDACDYAPHSPYIEEAASRLGDYAKMFLPKETAKLRSPAWVSTSALEKDWESPAVKYVSGEYFMNNMRNQVYFYEALLHIPKSAFIVEISPKAIFSGILKETVGRDSEYLSPVTRNETISPGLLSKQVFRDMVEEGTG